MATPIKGNSVSRGLYHAYAQLSAPATGETLDLVVPAPTHYTLVTTVAGVNTNVVVNLEGSIDNSNWTDLLADETITSNGTTHRTVSGAAVRYVRPAFVSEAGGTDATVTFGIGVA